jgi:hypothetical protein
MNCSVGNSKSQLHKARMKLRDWLRQNEGLMAPGEPVVSDQAPTER